MKLRTGFVSWGFRALPLREPVFPVDWNYSPRMVPAQLTRDEVLEVCDRVPREMVEAFLIGTPDEVAEQVDAYVKGGANLVEGVDLLSVALPIEEAMGSDDRVLEVLRRVRARQ